MAGVHSLPRASRFDIESHFVDSAYLADINQVVSKANVDQMIREALSEAEEECVERYVNGRIEIKRQGGTHSNINHGKLAVEAKNKVEKDPRRFGYGKALLKRLRHKCQTTYSINLKTYQTNELLKNDALATIGHVNDHEVTLGQAAKADATGGIVIRHPVPAIAFVVQDALFLQIGETFGKILLTEPLTNPEREFKSSTPNMCHEDDQLVGVNSGVLGRCAQEKIRITHDELVEG